MSANNVNIVATGGAADSNIRAIGSTISAGNTVNLAADNAISLEASKNTWEQHGTNKSSGASVGVGVSTGSQKGFTIELGVSQGAANVMSMRAATSRPPAHRSPAAAALT